MDRVVRQIVLRNGLVDLWFKWPWYAQRSGETPQPKIPFGWVVGLSANALLRLAAFRDAAQTPACEYALELELRSVSGPTDCPVQLTYRWQMGGIGEDFGSAIETPVILDLYSVGDRDEVMNLIVRDLYDASGINTPPADLKIDWPSP